MWTGNWSLEVVCRMLAIVQDQNSLEIRNHVYELQKLKLVTLFDMDYGDVLGDYWMDKKWLEISSSKGYKKVWRKLLSKNPHLNTFQRLSHIAKCTTELFFLRHIRALSFYKCQELESVDLVNFPHLRCLNIMHCAKLKVVNGWEGVKGLGWIEIGFCPSYCNLPGVQFLSFLKEFRFHYNGGPRIPWQVANFSQCVQLRRLEILWDDELVESMDLKALRFLEVLSFPQCTTLSTIQGLSGLQTLVYLNIRWCKSFKMVPNLGYLKALTCLEMACSGIVEIPGIVELHLLTTLDLNQCESLESLPPLGHLKALVYLDVRYTGVEEILGVEDLVSLETLQCKGSKLKQLPNLDHLHRLREINIDDTPLSRMDPSRSFIGGYELIDNDRKKEGFFLDDISDISDTNNSEDISSDED